MSKFSEKISPFIFGLSIGLLAACLFFIFKLDEYVRKFDFSALNQKKQVSEEIVVPLAEKESTEEKRKVRKSNTNPAKKESHNEDTGTSYTSSASDSGYRQNENYKVLKEELVSVKNLYVKVLTPKEKTSSSDSLIASLAGVSVPDEGDKEFFMIEFWKTPLNSKGYKMTRSRLLIYGYPENQDVAIVKVNEVYYLRNNSQIFKLAYSSEFKPLERATSEEAADKFN
jgi:hypothetical protein